MDLAWAITKREIEHTARAVVDELLGRGNAASAPNGEPNSAVHSSVNSSANSSADATGRAADDLGTGDLGTGDLGTGDLGTGDLGTDADAGAAAEAPTLATATSPTLASISASISPEEFAARAEALLLIGEQFSGERPHRTVDKALVGLNQLASQAALAKGQAGVLAGAAAAKAGSFFGGLLAKKPTALLNTAPESASASGATPPPPEGMPVTAPPPSLDGASCEPPASLGAFFTAFISHDPQGIGSLKHAGGDA